MSMKNKFVTAVTTAGLLAGIFGSAFVPTARAAAGVLDATETTFSETELDGSGTSAAPYLLVSADTAADAESDATLAFDIEDSNGTDIPQNTVWTATTTGAIRMSNGTAKVSTYSGYVGAGGDISIEMAVAATTSTGTGTLTLTVGGGSETVYFRAVGAASTLTLTNAGASALAAGTASTVNKLELAVKDAGGYALSAPADNTVSWELATGSAGAIGDVVEAGDDGKFSLDTTACDAATSLTAVGDTAKSYTVRAKIGDVYSNYVSIKCTDNGQFAVLTGVALDAKSYDVATNPKVVFTFQDGFGNLLGEGGTVNIDGGMDITAVGYGGKLLDGSASVATYTDADGTITAAGGMGKVAQTITSGATALGKEWMVFKVADKDLGVDEAQAASYTLRWTLIEPQPEEEATIVKSGFKVTADFGDLGSKKKISFVVENVATGSVVTYVRKANAAGVASYTIGRKGTFEIYAMLGDEITETVIVKR